MSKSIPPKHFVSAKCAKTNANADTGLDMAYRSTFYQIFINISIKEYCLAHLLVRLLRNPLLS